MSWWDKCKSWFGGKPKLTEDANHAKRFRQWVQVSKQRQAALQEAARVGKTYPLSDMVRVSERDANRRSLKVIRDPFALHESNIAGLSPEDRLIIGRQKRKALRNFAHKERGVQQNLMTMWTDAVSNRRDFLMAQQELSQFYIVDQIVETIVGDALNPNERGEIIDFSCEDPLVKDALDDLARDHNLNNFLHEIAEDLVYMGELTVGMEAKQGEGLIEINDNLNQLGILALYERGLPSNYLVLMNGEYTIMPASSYAHFVLGSRKLRVSIDNAIDPDYQIDWANVDEDVKKELPDYVRIGKPMFMHKVAKLRELQLLENLIVALKLNQLTQSRLVAVRVPPSMPAEEVAEVIDDINDILNSQTGVDISKGFIGIAEMMSQTGHFQAVPNYLDEKGAMMPLNVREDVSVDDLLAAIENLRQVILSSIGIPYTLIYGGEQRGERGEGNRAGEIRRFGRYARKLGSIQLSMSKGIKQIALCHLRNLGIECSFDSFDVVFINSMVDIAGLEKIEFDDAKQEIVARKLEFIEKMVNTPVVGEEIHWPGVFEWLDDAFMDLTDGIPLFKFSKKLAQQKAQETDDEVMDNDLRDQFLNMAAKNFIVNRELRDDDAPAAEEVEEDAVFKTTIEAEKFISKVKDNFERRRKLRNQDIQESDPDAVADIIINAADRFLVNRRRRAVLSAKRGSESNGYHF